jgi:hypothetical protein
MSISSTDQLPIYRDSLDEPLSFGRIEYFSYSSPSTKKTIYANVERTVELENPVNLQGDGRADNQIFLGSGLYLVKYYKWNGVDPLTDLDESWSLDHECVEEGIDSSND